MIETKPMLGPYTLLRLIGRGGMSSVYEAEDERMGRRVAIKVMIAPPGLTESAEESYLVRFRREARTIARLTHPNIVTVYDVGEQGRDHYLVMEYLAGMTVRQRIEAQGPLLPSDAARLLEQVASGLDAIHAAGIVHRDMKSSNIMLTDLDSGGPRVRILDFGVARPVGDATMTQVGTFIGTPAYLAPEQVQGAQAAPSADIWALGVLLYEMLTGRSPFPGDLLPAVIYKIVHEPPDPAPELPGSVQEVLLQALAKDPAERFASGGALANAYRNALALPRPSVMSAFPEEPLPASEAPTVIVPESRRPEKRRRSSSAGWFGPSGVALAAILLLGLIGTGIFLSSSGKKTNRTASSARGSRVLPALRPPPLALSPARPRATPSVSMATTATTATTVKALTVRKRVPRVAARPVPSRRPRPTPTAPPLPKAPPVAVLVPAPAVVLPVPPPTPAPSATPSAPTVALEELRGELEAYLNAWIEFSEKKDVDRLIDFYPAELERYYTLLNVSAEHVLNDKYRMFSRARRVELKVSDLDITVGPDGHSAILRYRKDYKIVGGPGARQGAVRSELRVRRYHPDEDWKIYYERDPAVLRSL